MSINIGDLIITVLTVIFIPIASLIYHKEKVKLDQKFNNKDFYNFQKDYANFLDKKNKLEFQIIKNNHHNILGQNIFCNYCKKIVDFNQVTFQMMKKWNIKFDLDYNNVEKELYYLNCNDDKGFCNYLNQRNFYHNHFYELNKVRWFIKNYDKIFSLVFIVGSMTVIAYLLGLVGMIFKKNLIDKIEIQDLYFLDIIIDASYFIVITCLILLLICMLTWLFFRLLVKIDIIKLSLEQHISSLERRLKKVNKSINEDNRKAKNKKNQIRAKKLEKRLRHLEKRKLKIQLRAMKLYQKVTKNFD